MEHASQREQIDRNYDAFQRMLHAVISSHRDEYALMRDCAVIGFFESAGEAYRAGLARFTDEIFSIQEVTDAPIDLGFYSHVGSR